MNNFKVTKPVRIIELFGGYGSQSLALKYLNVNFEHWKLCEWAVKSIQAYKDIHMTNDDYDYSKNLTKNEVVEYLSDKGISWNYNEPMTKEQISKRDELWCRTVYNNIQATHDLVDISRVHARDLGIADTEKYQYILTYSFPCQDLSTAGQQKGMEFGSNTRSSLLWQVGRILVELKNSGIKEMPILLMENVPQVHGTKNKKNWDLWLSVLAKLGYQNIWQDINAKDYGIPQNRNRCFCLSIPSNAGYSFLNPVELKCKMKNIIETNVDEKYFLDNSKILSILNWKAQQRPFERVLGINSICPTITARGAGEMHSGMILFSDKLGDTTNVEREYYHYNITADREQYLGMFQYAKSEQFMHGKRRSIPNKETSDTLQTSQKEAVVLRIDEDLKVRSLTPKECFRLQGVKDYDYYNVAKNQTDQSLYHLAGDSICVASLITVLKNLFY